MLYKAHGVFLTRYAALYGIRRRWFGLEPDFMLRRRMLQHFYDHSTG